MSTKKKEFLDQESEDVGAFQKLLGSVREFYSEQVKPESKWFNVKNSGNGKAELDIWGDIGSFFFGVTAQDLRRQVKALGQISELTVNLNSKGGSVWDGLAIYQMFLEHSAKVIVRIQGIAASSASIIAMAGDEIHIAENGFMMMHQPYAGIIGNSAKLRKGAEVLDKLEERLVATYVKNSSLKEEEVKSMIKEETWLNAQECLDHGLVTEIIEPVEAKNFTAINYSGFNNVPGQILNAVNVVVNKTEDEDKEEKEDEMKPEEIQELVNKAVETAVAPLQTKLTESEAKLTEANNKLEARLNTRNETTHLTNMSARLDALVSSQRILPLDKETYLNFIKDIPEDRASAFLTDLEKRPRILNSDQLTQEVTDTKGEKKFVEVDRMFTNPVGINGALVGPDPLAFSQFSEVASTSKSYEDFRNRAYAAHGEMLPSGLPSFLVSEESEV